MCHSPKVYIEHDSVARKSPISSFKLEPVSHPSWPMKSRLLLNKSFIFSFMFLIVCNLHCFHTVSRTLLERVNYILICAANVIQKNGNSFVINLAWVAAVWWLWTSPDLEDIFSHLLKSGFFKWLFHWKKVSCLKIGFPMISLILTIWWFKKHSKLNFNINFTQFYKQILHILIGAAQFWNLIFHNNL